MDCLIKLLSSQTFWTAFGAIGTFVMVYCTYRTLQRNDKQLRILEDDKKAKILFCIVENDYNYYLEIKNIGNAMASRIKFKVNKAFLSKLSEYAEVTLSAREDFEIYLNPKEEKYYAICSKLKEEDRSCFFVGLRPKIDLGEIIKELIQITGSYFDSVNLVQINEKFCIRNFCTGSSLYKDNDIGLKLHEVVGAIYNLDNTISNSTEHVIKVMNIQSDEHTKEMKDKLDDIVHSIDELSTQE